TSRRHPVKPCLPMNQRLCRPSPHCIPTTCRRCWPWTKPRIGCCWQAFAVYDLTRLRVRHGKTPSAHLATSKERLRRRWIPCWLLGVADGLLMRLPARFEALVRAAAALAGLRGNEFARLYRLAPQLRAMCSTLAQYRVPQTLVHGDLHAKNIAIRHGRYL